MHSALMAGTPASSFEYHRNWQFPSDHFMDESGICPADAASRQDDDNLENENVSGGQAFPDAGKHPRDRQPEKQPPSQPDLLDQPNPPTADPDYRQHPPETVTPDPHKAYPPANHEDSQPEPEIIDDKAKDKADKSKPEVMPPPDGFFIKENTK